MALELIPQSEMIEDLAERTGWTKSDVRVFFTHLNDFTQEAVGKGYRVKLPVGVVIAPVVKKATKRRKGRNPATGEEITISAKPASSKIRLSIVKPLRDVKLPSVKKLQSYGA